jgi:hypothetical protein
LHIAITVDRGKGYEVITALSCRDKNYRVIRNILRPEVRSRYNRDAYRKRNVPFDPWRRYGPKPWNPNAYLPAHFFAYWQYIWERAVKSGKIPTNIIRNEKLIKFKYENGWRNEPSDGYIQHCGADKGAVFRGKLWYRQHIDSTWVHYMKNTGQWKPSRLKWNTKDAHEL